MIRKAQLEATLRKLLLTGSLPGSMCGTALYRTTAPLVSGGVLTWQPSGAGKKLVVVNQKRFAEFVAGAYPQSSIEATSLPSSRVLGVARYRDSKAHANDVPEIVSVRGWADGVLRCNEKPVAVALQTVQYGLFSFLLGDNNHLSLHCTCALIESPAVFTAFEGLKLSMPLILYGHGRISKRMVNWLARQDDPVFKLLHMPDYDPVGLNEFLRLRDALGDRVQLHITKDLDERFRRFSKCELLNKSNSQKMLGRLRSSKCPEVISIVELIDRHNAGLEQEALHVSL
ncbi:MAG TPA: hypothetical protein VFC07_11395 [Verrucomicrobiae bacterium]|nr:hypothetical protein [Verrucomicrobiae bacterium]